MSIREKIADRYCQSVYHVSLEKARLDDQEDINAISLAFADSILALIESEPTGVFSEGKCDRCFGSGDYEDSKFHHIYVCSKCHGGKVIRRELTQKECVELLKNIFHSSVGLNWQYAETTGDRSLRLLSGERIACKEKTE